MLRYKKNNINEMLIIVLPIIATYSRSLINIFPTPNTNKVNIQYNNAITIDLLALWIFVALFITLLHGIKKEKFKLKSGFELFLFISIISILYPNNQNRILSIYGITQIIKYFSIVLLLCYTCEFNKFYICIKKGFKIGLILQTLIGSLFVFWHISIPYITGSNITNIRNGFYRMFGTMSTSGEFSLYMIILLIFFFIDFSLMKQKSSIIYSLIACFDLYFSGARSMSIVGIIIIIYLLLYLYKDKIMLKLYFKILIIILVYYFFKSEYFYEFFIRNNFFEMLNTRMIHWKVGIQLFFEKFLFGVGLNNNATYLNNNFDLIFNNISYSKILVDKEFLKTAPIHNSFLVVACELGILGIISFLRIYFIAFKKNIFLFKYLKDKDEKKYIIFPIVSLIVFIIYGCQGWAMLKQPAWIMFSIIIVYTNLAYKKFNK